MSESLFAVARAGFPYERNQHHFRCATRGDEGCDCYARHGIAAHQALDAIEAAVRDAATVLRHVAIAEPSSRMDTEDAHNRVNLAVEYLRKTGPSMPRSRTRTQLRAPIGGAS